MKSKAKCHMDADRGYTYTTAPGRRNGVAPGAGGRPCKTQNYIMLQKASLYLRGEDAVFPSGLWVFTSIPFSILIKIDCL